MESRLDRNLDDDDTGAAIDQLQPATGMKDSVALLVAELRQDDTPPRQGRLLVGKARHQLTPRPQ